jgi:hypothetical protein
MLLGSRRLPHRQDMITLRDSTADEIPHIAALGSKCQVQPTSKSVSEVAGESSYRNSVT